MSDIHFGTDGWRAIIGEDFTIENVVRVVSAAAEVFQQQAVESGRQLENPGVLYIGHDCRLDAHYYALLAAEVAAEYGFEVKVTNTYCPTPALCWSVAHDKDAVGGIMLTSSHNPAEYLGIKLRMRDGGASPKEFTDIVEKVMSEHSIDGQASDDPAINAFAHLTLDQIKNAIDSEVSISSLNEVKRAETKPVQETDLMSAYLASLRELVDTDSIKAAGLKVVIDPLYGAGRIYLANLLRDMGVEVCEINNAEDPTFDGLHPEPIQPWVDRGLAKVKELGYDALFINDGDADRISAGDSRQLRQSAPRNHPSHKTHDTTRRDRQSRLHHHSVRTARSSLPQTQPRIHSDPCRIQMDLRRNGKGRCHDWRRGVRRNRTSGARQRTRRTSHGASSN